MNKNRVKKDENSSLSQAPRGRGRGPSFGKPKNFKKAFNQLMKYLKPYSFWLIVSIVLSIASALFTVLTPYLTGKLITALYYFVDSGIPIGQISVDIIPNVLNITFNQTLVMLLLSVILTSLTGYLQSYLINGISQSLTYKMRSDLAEKVNTLPLNYFDKHSHGDVLNRMTTAVETVNANLTSSLSEIFRSIATVITIIIMLYWMNWQLASIIVVSIIISLIVATRFIKYTQKYFRQREVLNSTMNGHIEEVYNGHAIVKVFNYEQKAKDIFNDQNEQMHTVTWKSQFISGIMFPVQMFFGNLSYIAISIFGGYLVMTGALEPGFILTYVTYVRRINQPVQQIGQTATVLQQITAAAERVFEILDAESEPIEDVKHDISKFKGNVLFENVHFGYLENQPVIKGFSASVKAGQTIAIVGPTGAGKTTMVNLLMRFYEVNEGRILIDGIDIKELTRNQVRSLFGMVLQDTWIFDGTVDNNIRYGSINASDNEVKAATKQAQLDHYIRSLPGSYNFHLQEDGVNISQGQRQLLTIARAMLANRPMLILDEATSSVDTRTEVLIQQAMDNLMINRTSFVIAHRLSTIRNADLILVMNDGNIVEQGTHNELLEQDGFYAKLYNSQFEQ